jgi:hypothetical protein
MAITVATKLKVPKPRNPIAIAARQRLAGSHRKSNTAHRQQRKRELVRLLMRKDET